MTTCCDIMEAQLNYVCNEHGNECPDIVIRYSDDYEAHSLYSPNAEYACYYCPWCGTKLNPTPLEELAAQAESL